MEGSRDRQRRRGCNIAPTAFKDFDALAASVGTGSRWALLEQGVCPDAASYLVHWWGCNDRGGRPMPRIVTPLDAEGRPHGAEKYLYMGITSMGTVRFCHGRAMRITKDPQGYMETNSLYTLDNLHEINLAFGAFRRERYGGARAYCDHMNLINRAGARFLLAASSEPMRRLPPEMRHAIWERVLPEAVRAMRRPDGRFPFYRRPRSASWLDDV